MPEQNNITKYLIDQKKTTFYYDRLDVWISFNPIIVNREILGWVSIVSESDGFTELERIAIDKCSTIIALEVLKNNELSTMEQSLKGDFLDNLLWDNNSELVKLQKILIMTSIKPIK